MKPLRNIAVLSFSFLLFGAAVQAQKPKKPVAPVKPPAPNQTKGQGQVVGADGQFGVVYSLKNGLNFAIVGARYGDESVSCYSGLFPNDGEKIFTVDVAVKNATPADNDHFGSGNSLVSLIDQNGQKYDNGTVSLQSGGEKELFVNLKPGQGLGQPDLKDPLRIHFAVPDKARIVKVIVNQGRLNRNEEVIRYYVAGATKAEAGEAGDPKNVVAGLPERLRDPADPSGATALAMTKGAPGTFVPSGSYALRLDGFAYVTGKIGDNELEEGKRFGVATVTVKNTALHPQNRFDALSPETQLADADGEKYTRLIVLKAKRDEEYSGSDIEPGGEIAVRVVFAIPKDAAAKTLILRTNKGRKVAWDIAGAK